MEKKHLVVRRHGGVEGKAHVVVEVLHPGARRQWWEARATSCRRINHHEFPKQEETVAMIHDVHMITDVFRAHVVVKLRGPHRRAREEVGRIRIELLHEEDPVEREGEEVRAQQAAVVDHGAPAFADATGHGEGAGGETAEDASEDVAM